MDAPLSVCVYSYSLKSHSVNICTYVPYAEQPVNPYIVSLATISYSGSRPVSLFNTLHIRICYSYMYNLYLYQIHIGILKKAIYSY